MFKTFYNDHLFTTATFSSVPKVAVEERLNCIDEPWIEVVWFGNLLMMLRSRKKMNKFEKLFHCHIFGYNFATIRGGATSSLTGQGINTRMRTVSVSC